MKTIFLALLLVHTIYGATTLDNGRTTALRMTSRPSMTGTRPAMTGTKDMTKTGTRPAMTGTKDMTGTRLKTGTKPAMTGTKDMTGTRLKTGTKPAPTGTKIRPTGTTRPLTRPPPPVRPEPSDCATVAADSLAAKYCCFKGLLTGSTKCPDGDKDVRPARCDANVVTPAPLDGKTRAPADGSTRAPADGSTRAPSKTLSILAELSDKLDCRKIQPSGDKPEADPRRDTIRIVDKVKQLTQKGKQCAKNFKLAVEAVKTLVDQWQGKPTKQPRQDATDLEADTISDTFFDTTDVAVALEKLNSGFDAANIDATAQSLLPVKEDDTGKPRQCQAQWQEYKDALGQVIAKFKQLPQKFKEANVKTVRIALSDIDMGRVDWKDDRSVCKFAEIFVKKMKEARESLSKKLNRIREIICKEGGKLVTVGKPGIGTKTGALARCIREKRTGNQTKSDSDANNQVYDRIRAKTNKFLEQIRKRCVSKKDGGEARIPLGKTVRRIRMKIKDTCQGAQDVSACKTAIIGKIKVAIKAANPTAAVDVTLGDAAAATTTQAARRRLAELGANVAITQEGAPANPDYQTAVNSALGETVQVTSDSTDSLDTISAPADVTDASQVPTVPTQVSAGIAAHLAAAVLPVAFALL